jgi:hypothetical protein
MEHRGLERLGRVERMTRSGNLSDDLNVYRACGKPNTSADINRQACRARRIAMHKPTLCSGRDKRVPPNDGSVGKRIRRGMPVMPAEVRWMIQHAETDATSASLRTMEAWANEFGGACLSCPPKRNGSSNVAQRTRQARPSEGDVQVQFRQAETCAENMA